MSTTVMIEKGISGLVIGGILGFSYGLFRGFIAQPGFVERLDPRPECFHIDPDAARAFFELGKYRYNNERAYEEAMHNMDSLFCLEIQLRNKEVEPQLQDPVTAIDYAIRCLTQLRILKRDVQEQNIYDEIDKWIKLVERSCENHTKNVELLCRTI